MTTTTLPVSSKAAQKTCRMFTRVFADVRPANLRPEREAVIVRELAEWSGDRMFLRYDWDCRKNQFVAATLRLQISPSRGQIWLGSLEIHPHHRRRGVGTEIVTAVERAAVVTGVQTIRLFTRQSASRFWRKLDYESEADRRYFRKNLNLSKS